MLMVMNLAHLPLHISSSNAHASQTKSLVNCAAPTPLEAAEKKTFMGKMMNVTGGQTVVRILMVKEFPPAQVHTDKARRVLHRRQEKKSYFPDH